jgi:hypothetical protein
VSTIGTNVAASVAPAAQQAQQVARQRDAQSTQTQGNTALLRDLFDSHLKSLEETNRDESATHLHVDGQLPEHQSPQDGKHPPRKPQPAPSTDEATPPASEETPPADADPAPLYRHLDVQA